MDSSKNGFLSKEFRLANGMFSNYKNPYGQMQSEN